MNKILTFSLLIILTACAWSQNRIVRTDDLTDSLDARFAGAGLSATPVASMINDSTDVVRAEFKAVDDSLAEDIANIADSNFVLTSETSTWDKDASNDVFPYAGTDSIHYSQDSIVVSHGVGSTPRFVVIQLVSDGFGFQTWISGINSLTFYVRRSDTGLKTITSSIQFKWMAYK